MDQSIWEPVVPSVRALSSSLDTLAGTVDAVANVASSLATFNAALGSLLGGLEVATGAEHYEVVCFMRFRLLRPLPGRCMRALKPHAVRLCGSV